MPHQDHESNRHGSRKHDVEMDTDPPRTSRASLVPTEFGIWQYTAALHMPTAMQALFCSSDLPRSKQLKLADHVQRVRISGEHNVTFDRLAEAEGRLRATFSSEGLNELIPIYSDPNSTAQISPTLRRQSVKLFVEAPFDWLSPQARASFTFRDVGGTQFFNDFFVRSVQQIQDEHQEVLDAALFNIASILADRRSYMLAQGLAERTYNIFLPPAIMHDASFSARRYIVIPALSCIRLSNTSYFRRTFTLSLMVVPVSKYGNNPRSLDPDESLALQSGWTLIPEPDVSSYVVPQGGLRRFVARHIDSWNQTGEVVVTLRELLQDVMAAIVIGGLELANTDRERIARDEVRDLVVRAVQASVCGGYCSIMSNITASEFRCWQGDPFDEKRTSEHLRQEFVKILGPIITHEWALAEPASFRLHHGRGAEPLIPTFYFSFGPQRILFTPSPLDLESQYTSILWTVGWHLLLMTGLSALLEMLGTFHHEMEYRRDATSAQEFLGEFLVDIEEYFDFDLLPVYRLDFDSLKKVEGIDQDFERLRERVAALGQERIIEESRKVNRRLLWIAIASFLISIAVLIFTLRPPKPSESSKPAYAEPANYPPTVNSSQPPSHEKEGKR
jgi:hypothetical protein